MLETWIRAEVSNGNQYTNEETGDLVLAYGVDYKDRWLGLNTKIQNNEVTIIDLEETQGHKEGLKHKLILKSECFWRCESIKEITFETKVFLISKETLARVVAKQNEANEHEAANGGGTWSFSDWVLKDKTYFNFTLTKLNDFAALLLAQIEHAEKNENEHTKAIEALDVTVKTAAEIEAYDFTTDLTT